MRSHLLVRATAILLAFTASTFTLKAFGESIRVNCDADTRLQRIIDRADPGDTILLTGTCQGPVTISRGALTIRGTGTAVIDGQQKDAITVNGARNIRLEELDVRNGVNGIVASGGAHVSILNTVVHDNSSIGILLESNASADLSGGGARRNGLNGIDLEASSSVILTGNYLVEANGVFGMNINGSSNLTFVQANLQVDQNTLGVQIATSASAFIGDSVTKLAITNNATTGLTVVSGAHMVAFGGTIVSANNGVHGISVDSKAGLDLDAATLVESHDNAGDGVHLEETSVMTLFNTTAFSGVPGVTTLKSYNNGGDGINVLTGSNLTLIHQAAVNSYNNKGFGIQADNNSSVTVIQSNVTGNQKDIVLSFGSRADITGTTFGSITCDATVLIRGDTGTVCPK